MNKKKLIIILLAIVCILSIGLVVFNCSLNKKGNNKETDKDTGKVSAEEEKPDLDKAKNIKNKYYSVYIKYDGGPATSFVPISLNPDFDPKQNYNVAISTDDNGNIINDDKIIVINNLIISDENKEMIKKIAGNKYDEAIQEIQGQVDNFKNQLKEKGVIK